MYVLGVLLVAQHVQRKAQDGLVVAAHQRIESAAVAALRLADQVVVLGALLGAPSICSWVSLPPFLSVSIPSCAVGLAITGDDFIAPERLAPRTGGCVHQRGEAQRRGNAFAPLARPPPTIAESTGESSPPVSRPKAFAFIVTDSGARKWITSIDRREAKR